ncbi:kelch repeat-containing protein [candidate division KSB1 bacterium]
MRIKIFVIFVLSFLVLTYCGKMRKPLDVPSNTWTMVDRDEEGARRHSSFRYVENGDYFLLWGYMGYITSGYGYPHIPYEDNVEYDIVVFDSEAGGWQNQFPFEKEDEWSRELPPMYLCRLYQGITTGSYRPQLKMRDGVLRPDLNIVFDQVTYDSERSRMVYFTGGRTFSYDVVGREWSDIGSEKNPPPVLGGSLCYDPFNDEIILAGGGHVAETGPDGKPVGYTGSWIYNCKSSLWQPLNGEIEPPPRIASRLVCDTKNKLLVVFGGDAQSHYLADTWIYDTRIREWRSSKAQGSPPPRAGHFTVYDPGTGWVIIGGGYNREELTDMWAYDAAQDKWFKLKGEVPVGWYVTADIAPDEGLIILTTSTKQEGDTRNCNEIYSVRTTYTFKVEKEGLVDEEVIPVRYEKILNRSIAEATAGTEPDAERRKAQMNRLSNMPENEWVLLSEPGRDAPMRTWGSCAFDTDKSRIIYWGGGHCGYGGNDYDFYDVEENTWTTSPLIPEYLSRSWDKGINAHGVTFSGAPWIRHGRKLYAYDPVSKKIINLKTIYLTAGYDPEVLQDYPPHSPYFGEGEGFTESGYVKWPTWTYDPDTEQWEIVCSGAVGLDLAAMTPHGVMALDQNWRAMDWGERTDMVTFEGEQVAENAIFLLDVAGRSWKKLSTTGPWPQNLYELTALVYDSKREQLILHGGGEERDELWIFKMATGRWQNMKPTVASPKGGNPPVCRREGVYIPGEDVFFTCGYSAEKRNEPGVYVYRVSENAWHRVDIPAPPGEDMRSIVGQNRAITYDSKHNLVLMVLGERSGDVGKAVVYALRYSHSKAELVK